jgi:predicted PurR-regulated permease PerM
LLIAFLAYNVLESNVLLPRIYGRTMGISSIAVIIAVLVGVHLLGLLGVLISLPAAAAIPEIERAWRMEDIANPMDESSQIITRGS